ncbi:MAG: hypothetical protein ACXVEE_27075 [Polyangiales bacterium]
MSLRIAVAAVLAASAIACVGTSEQSPSESSSTGEAKLVVESMTADRVAGRLDLGNDAITFESVRPENGVYELTVKVHGMTLDSTIAFDDHTSSFDGFGTGTGDDTMMRDTDREVVAKLYRAINEQLPKELPEAGVVLRRAVGIWGENPSTVRLDRTIFGDEGRSYTMVCSYAKCDGYYTGGCSAWNYYSYAKHDCQHGGSSDSNNQQIAQLGDHYSGSGDERYYNGSSWVWGEPDHWSHPKVTGNCFGRSGGGCGGDTQYTVDATNHDGCVRNGHALASAYCDDEFTSASDDELYAPNCY